MGLVGEGLRRKGLGIREVQKEGVATRGRWDDGSEDER